MFAISLSDDQAEMKENCLCLNLLIISLFKMFDKDGNCVPHDFN